MRRALETGVDGYFLAPDLAGLAQVTRDAALGKPVGVLGTGSAMKPRSVLEPSGHAPSHGTLHVVDPGDVRLTADQLDAVAIDATEWIDRLGLTHVDQHRQLTLMLSSLTTELLSRGVDVVCAHTETAPPPQTHNPV